VDLQQIQIPHGMANRQLVVGEQRIGSTASDIPNWSAMWLCLYCGHPGALISNPPKSLDLPQRWTWIEPGQNHGFPMIVTDAISGKLRCGRKKGVKRQECTGDHMRGVRVHGQAVIFRRHMYTVCAQSGCGLTMKHVPGKLPFTEHGYACYQCAVALWTKSHHYFNGSGDKKKEEPPARNDPEEPPRKRARYSLGHAFSDACRSRVRSEVRYRELKRRVNLYQ
jgi:hypothetical protein